MVNFKIFLKSTRSTHWLEFIEGLLFASFYNNF